MKRALSLAAVLVTASVLAGCGQTPGTTRNLGAVEYAPAFATARQVLSQYFSVESDDEATGVIQSRPKSEKEAWNRLAGGSPTRQVATMRLRKAGANVIAQLSIAVQARGGDIHGVMPRTREDYSTVPNQTPAEGEAATTAEQNEAWRTDRYDHALERKILDDIARAIESKPAPATAPAAASGGSR
jgi:ribosomal protein L12E/L44/L45/RPP1/RPP2